METSQSVCADNIVLPTFSAEIINSNSKIPVRIFKDSGSQRTFIRNDVFNKLKSPVIRESLSLTVHGFNSSKNIDTKVVEIPLLIGKNKFNVNAIVTVKLSTKFKIDGLREIVDKFKSCGYEIADKNYNNINSNVVDNLDIILGSDAGHILPTSTVCFGLLPSQSSFINTQIGVIFVGNITDMIRNLDDLSHNTVSTVSSCDVECDTTNHSLDKNSVIRSPLAGRRTSLSNDSESIKLDCNLPDLAVDESLLFIDKLATSDELSMSIADLGEPPIDTSAEPNDPWETETNLKLIDFVLNNTERDSEGRLVMPITWNNKNSHLLGQNYNLSRSILFSTIKKLKQDPTKLKLYNDVFKEQCNLGIIEKIEHVQTFMDLNPSCSYLPHMGVFRLDHDSTKCRVVFLSNLCENTKSQISHNQAILPGPCLNHKITTAVTLLRFDKFLLTFDLKKAFLSIKLRECDSNRLLCLWFKDVEKGDYSLVAYRNLRLSFGLRCSPTILMLGLFKILIQEQTGDKELDCIKKLIYNSMYMDNGSYTCNDPDYLNRVYKILGNIFSPYKFELQQFCTNLDELQQAVDDSTGELTSDDVKLFGMTWNRKTDTLIPNKIVLDAEANTKRTILKTINAVYDIYNLYAPILLRARIFMQSLQANKLLNWDTRLPDSLINEWKTIVKQANNAPQMALRRAVGQRNGRYKLIACTDSSKVAYGVVIYIKDLHNNVVTFLRAKYKLVGTTSRRTIPALELLAIRFGMEILLECMQSLCGDTIVEPVTMEGADLYTDSMVSLHWVQSHSIAFNKLQKLSVAVKNTLRAIDELSIKVPVTLRHISGEINPSDCLTKPCSYRTLCKYNFVDGPEFLRSETPIISDLVVTLPNPVAKLVDEVPVDENEIISNVVISGNSKSNENSNVLQDLPTHLIPLNKYSNLRFLVNIHGYVLKFVNLLKQRVLARKNNIVGVQSSSINYYSMALNEIISTEQRIVYPDVFTYLEAENKSVHNVPILIAQLNLFKDENEVLRVRSKFGDRNVVGCRPVLLPKSNALTTLIIGHMHVRLAHAGIYAVLKELRKEFWITHYFSTVKKVIKSCIVCRKIHEPSIKLNQSSYRDFRAEPIQKPFSSVFIDHIGPFVIKIEGVRKKVWLLIFTCLWSRAINLKICHSLNVNDFLRAVQLHIFDYGIFQHCLSDLGSQIQAGANVIRTFLSDHETSQFFSANGMTQIKFQHYAKGNSSLGSLIEICVKQVKYLMFKSIGSLILSDHDFQFLISKTIHLINKRPVAFKESLRSLPIDEVPQPITPEMLCRGYETISINVLPNMQSGEDEYNPNSSETARNHLERLCKIKDKMIHLYHSEFLATLIEQAVDKKDRYKRVLHKSLEPGDVVLLVEKHCKRYNYPMGRVERVEINDLGEVTAAYVFKGSSRETVYRHTTSLIKLISNDNFDNAPATVEQPVPPTGRTRLPRRAAEICKSRLRLLQGNDPG